MNSTAGWGEARGTSGVSLTAGNVLWEVLKTDWSATAKEISGRPYPIPTPLRHLEARPAALDRHNARDWPKKQTPLCKVLSTCCCLWLLQPGQASRELCSEWGWGQEPGQLPIQTWHTDKMMAAACGWRRCSCTGPC